MRIDNQITKGSILLEEYIPLKFISDKKNTSLDYARYSKDNKSLLEFAYETNSKQLYRILLVLCENFSINDCCFSLPASFDLGSLVFEESVDNECSVFHCEVFKDAVTIKLSESKLNKSIISDNILWEVDDENELISITLFNLSQKEIEHTITELQYVQNMS